MVKMKIYRFILDKIRQMCYNKNIKFISMSTRFDTGENSDQRLHQNVMKKIARNKGYVKKIWKNFYYQTD
jgi:hypothetical protein